jgi:hypothetical protein
VEWKCTIADDGVFSNTSLDAVVYVDTHFTYISPWANIGIGGINSPEMQNAMKSLSAAMASMPKINLNYLKPPPFYRPTIAGKLFATVGAKTETAPEKPTE